MRLLHFTLSALLVLLITSCTSLTDKVTDGISIETRYAELLTMTEGDGFTHAVVKNPWDTTKVLHSYVLVPEGKEQPKDLPKGDVIRTPLKHSVVYSSVHCSLIDQMGAYGAIAGVADADYIYLPKVHDDLKAGKMADIGSSMTPDIEKLMDLSPDAILLSPFENSGSYGKLGTMGIPLIECADYMETSPLGRAEWVRFYGLLYGQKEKADSIFMGVEKEYNDLKGAVDSLRKAKATMPTLLADMKTGSTWYVAGANSTMGRMYHDAGASYIFSDEKGSGSTPYDPEVVFDRGIDADVWIVKYNQAQDKTLEELKQDWANNARIRAYNNKKVFGCNLVNSMFYEETPFHPELLLKDLIKILHPELLPQYDLRYFRPLSQSHSQSHSPL